MTQDFSSQLATWIQSACVREATARKPGNVHPQASFADLKHADLVKSAEVIAPIVAQVQTEGVGKTILLAAKATREQVGTNSNLGILLLLAPLARVPAEQSLAEGIGSVLTNLTQKDAECVYEAIRLSQPGGLGEAAEGDVSGEPTGTLVEMMQLAAGRDRIAAEYAFGFPITLKFGGPFLAGWPDLASDWETAVIELHLQLMANYPDTLITRKCGPAVAEESARRAQEVLSAGPPGSSPREEKLREFDDWLRADGHRRNPGTTADLVAASLFAALREGWLM